MLIIEGLNVREASEQLGVAENILYRWKQEHINDLESNKPTGGQSEVQRIIGPVSFQFPVINLNSIYGKINPISRS